MNVPFFIARRIAFQQKRSFSAFIIRVAILAIALSTCVMILGTGITRGYQKVISQKFYEQWGQVHITNFTDNPGNILSEEKIAADTTLLQQLSSLEGIQYVQTYNLQSCLLKTENDMEGIVLKGLDALAMQRYAKSNFVKEGSLPSYPADTHSMQILVSENIAKKLGLKPGSDVILYFINPEDAQPRARKIHISGLYSTGIEEYDNYFALGDQRLIHYINRDSTHSIQGYELYLDEKADAGQLAQHIHENMIEAPLQTYTLEERFPNVFSWLGMMKMNEKIIIIIMLIIAVINMITAQLILIMERTQMVGILKSLGMRFSSLQNIFLFNSVYIVGSGLALGALTGIGLAWAQMKFGLVSLDEKTYYVQKVPVYLDPITVILILTGTLFTCLVLLLIPGLIIKTIRPVKALRFN